MSARSATCRADSATLAPSLASASAFCGVRLKTCTSCPASSSRLTIGWPILPRPTNPACIGPQGTLGDLMRITGVETLPIDRYLFVQVHTDDGLTGLGEAGTWGFLEAAEQVVKKFATYLVGEDPLRIEHHWQYLYRSTHFRG